MSCPAMSCNARLLSSIHSFYGLAAGLSTVYSALETLLVYLMSVMHSLFHSLLFLPKMFTNKAITIRILLFIYAPKTTSRNPISLLLLWFPKAANNDDFCAFFDIILTSFDDLTLDNRIILTFSHNLKQSGQVPNSS